MKKFLVLSLMSFVIFVSQLYSISLTEYIQRYGMPQVDDDGRLDLGSDLAETDLTDITGLNTIPNIDRVKTLVLYDNALQTLPENAFQGFKNLEELFLLGNNLQTLPENVFQGLQNLKDLKLGYNKLVSLPVHIFKDLQNLEVLELNNNRLAELPAIGHLHKLEFLNINGNPFKLSFKTALSEILRNLPNLTSIIYEGVFPESKESVLKKLARSTLKGLAAEKVAQNIESYRPRLHELSFDIIDQLPLSKQEKLLLIREKVQKNIDQYDISALDRVPLPRGERIKLIVEKIKKNIHAYHNRLHELPSEILDALDLTPAQRAAIAAEKRRMGQ